MKYLLLMALFATGAQAEEMGGAMAIVDATFEAANDVLGNIGTDNADGGDDD